VRKLLSLFVLIALLLFASYGRVMIAFATRQAVNQLVRVCPDTPPGFAHCTAILDKPDITGQSSSPEGLGPSDLQAAYNLPSATAGQGQTIAVIDAYDDPNAESDLGVYREQFGLSPCTTANGCFQKIDQDGGENYPGADVSWATEISLDLDMASAICPNCHLLLVEASSDGYTDLGAAVNTAVRLGANVISNSYAGTEPDNAADLSENYYKHTGVAITASSGDGGYGASFPASSQYVTAVGGTSLKRDNSARGWNESAWSSTGSGCSAFIPKPSWQTDRGCSNRTLVDIAAVADPNPGVSVYDSYQQSGWIKMGGTSVATPIIAGVYALAGNESSIIYGSYPYSHRNSLFNITTGSNGTCNPSYLCRAGPGYNGPTGLGTPNGTGAF
jgi:subtilase family serine protease